MDLFDPDLVTAGKASDAQHDAVRAVIDHVASRFETPLYARVDLLTGEDGAPVLLELEAVEPNLYFDTTPGVPERLADAIIAEARR